MWLFSYRDILHSSAKETYIQVSNRSVMFCNYDTWATLLMLALDRVASEDGNKEVSKKAMSGVSRMIHKYPERLESDNWTGHKFTDFFTILKVDGEWKIMNKIFHLHA